MESMRASSSMRVDDNFCDVDLSDTHACCVLGATTAGATRGGHL